MCGVCGFVSYDQKGPCLKTLARLAHVTMSRGEDAFGFAWLDWSGRLKMYKRTGRIADYLGLLAMAKDARVLVGHCRWATHGDPKSNHNNHPHPADGGWIVHNGVVRNYKELVEDHDLYLTTSCDSEVLGLMIAAGEGSLQRRCVQTAREARGPLTMLGVWKNPAKMIAIRNGNPLHTGTVNDGDRYYLASLPTELPGVVEQVRDGTGLEFTPAGMTEFNVFKERQANTLPF